MQERVWHTTKLGTQHWYDGEAVASVDVYDTFSTCFSYTKGDQSSHETVTFSNDQGHLSMSGKPPVVPTTDTEGNLTYYASNHEEAAKQYGQKRTAALVNAETEAGYDKLASGWVG